jgi:hypothetical protein
MHDTGDRWNLWHLNFWRKLWVETGDSKFLDYVNLPSTLFPSTARITSYYLQYVSLKIPNNLNKSFSHLLWGYSDLSPSKYSPLIFIHWSQRFFQFWKHFWNASFRILLNSSSEFSLISSADSNHRPFSMDFSWVKTCARSGECRGWGQVSSHVLWENHKSAGMHQSVVMISLLTASLILVITFSEHSFFTVWPRRRNSWWITPSRSNYTVSVTFTLDQLTVFFGSRWRFWDPMQRLGFCFDIIVGDDVL